MRLGTTYISVNDFAKSLAFYQLLLEQEPLYCNDDRWATFDCGNSLSLYNRQFDIDFLVNNDYRGHYNHSYLTTLKNENSDKINTSVIFNFEVEDLISEYERIKKLKIGAVSELLFVASIIIASNFNFITIWIFDCKIPVWHMDIDK